MLFFTHVICVLALAINARAQIFANLFVVNWPVVAYRLASVSILDEFPLLLLRIIGTQCGNHMACRLHRPKHSDGRLPAM